MAQTFFLTYIVRRFAYWNKNDYDLAIGDYDQAIAGIDRGIALDPKNALAYGNRGLIFLTKGDIIHAWADLEKAGQLAQEPWMREFIEAKKGIAQR